MVGPQALLGMTCKLNTIEPFDMMHRILANMGLPPGMSVEVCPSNTAVQEFYQLLRSARDVGQPACIYMRVTVAT